MTAPNRKITAELARILARRGMMERGRVDALISLVRMVKHREQSADPAALGVTP